MRRDSHVPSQGGCQSTVSGEPSCALLVVGLTIYLESMFIAAMFCLSSAQAAHRHLSLAGCSRATYMSYHIVTAALLRPMSPSEDSKVFYRKSDRQNSPQTVPRRRTCGGLYTPPAFPTIRRTTCPVHIMRRTKEQSTLFRRTNP